MPNPVAWFFHHLPPAFHRFEVATTFFEQLVLPALLLVPVRSVRLFASVSELCFQLAIVGTGNYAWINFVGVLPCLALLDDGFLGMRLPRWQMLGSWAGRGVLFSDAAIQQACDADDEASRIESWGDTACTAGTFAVRFTGGAGARLLSSSWWWVYRRIRTVVYLALVAFIAKKSVDPIKVLDRLHCCLDRRRIVKGWMDGWMVCRSSTRCLISDLLIHAMTLAVMGHKQ
jgi:hypothetical protein